MEQPDNTPEIAFVRLLTEIRARLMSAARPIVVAIDGRSGTGKSTLAARLVAHLPAVVVPCDDFFAANISAQGWAERSPAARAADCLDWRRLRREAIEPLRAGLPGRWHAFDFARGAATDGTYAQSGTMTVCEPHRVVLLDGTYAARPELADVVDVAVLIEAAPEVRADRLRAREAAGFLAEWQARWGAAETHYFATIRPRETFEFVLTSAASEPAR